MCTWQNRLHARLRGPRNPTRTLTPNEKYAALAEVAGVVLLALSPDDYVELLPAEHRAINMYGIKIGHRTYDGQELTPFRRQRSGVAALKNRWEVYYDPYDVTRIWLRDDWNGGGWVQLFWMFLSSTPMRFGTMLWEHSVDSVRHPDGSVTQDVSFVNVESGLCLTATGPGDSGSIQLQSCNQQPGELRHNNGTL